MPWHNTLIDSEILSVHAALIPLGAKGTVVMLGGSEHNSAQGATDENPLDPAKVDRAALFDVAMRMDAVKISSPTTDVFCAGHAFLADGRLLIGGGTESWGGDVAGGPGGGHVHFHGNFGGGRACWIFNKDRKSWDRTMDFGFQVGPQKGGGRWYPSIITLPSGDLAAFGGHPSRRSENWHENNLPERYSATGNAWSWYPNAFGFDYSGILPGTWYPRVSLVTGGNLFFTSITSGKCRLFDPNSGSLVGPQMNAPGSDYQSSWNYAVISLPFVPEDGYRTRVMTVGGVQPQVIQLNPPASGSTPTWENAGTRQGAAAGKRRNYVCPVYLPTGEIFVSGGINGTDDDDAVKTPEIFTPNINWTDLEYQSGAVGTWQTLNEAASIPRNYHSVALLLPDGSVFASGSNIDGNNGDPTDATIAQQNIELYFPGYFNNSNRPTISNSPEMLASDDQTLAFDMSTSAEAAAIEKVTLIRCGSVTHAGDFDQRYVALRFNKEANSAQISAELPGDPSVLPPGYYMLWAVNSAGLPCKVAPFVRMAHVSCQIVTDRDVFSQEEVQSFSGTATFPSALYPMYDGFLPAELANALSVTVRWKDTGATVGSSDVQVIPAGARWLEHPNGWTEVAQRVTYPYSVRINPSAFTAITDKREIAVTFSANGRSCTGDIALVKTPNPYMTDIDPDAQNPHWLSTDIRTFRMRAGDAKYSGMASHGSDDAAAETFAKALINKFKALPNDSNHPFLDLPDSGSDAAVDLASSDASKRVYNYAVAKVRYRAQTTNAQNVKVFFRLCTTLSTGLAYNANGLYKVSATDATAVPLLGTAGGELVSIPFFLGPRQETRQGRSGAASMTAQTLVTDYEAQTISPIAGQEVTAYFVCWLDINHDVDRFPLDTGGGNGPWLETNCQPIRDFFRSPHHCLVAEVFFEPDLTAPGKTPSTSDNISQRNLALLNAENPGSAGGRHVVHPFEISRSRLPSLRTRNTLLTAFDSAGFSVLKTLPDELLFDWGTLPRDTEVTLYFSNIDTAEIMALAQVTRRSPAPFEVIDDKTLRMRVGNGSWLPVPGGSGPEIPALFSAQLPPSIQSGNEYRIAIHQVSGRRRVIIGSVEINIPATKAPLMVDGEVKNLSIMKHIKTRIPTANRWWPIFQRYIGFLEGRVVGLGVDPADVHPNPDGTGKPPTTRDPSPETDPGRSVDDIAEILKECCDRSTRVLQWGFVAIALVLLVLLILMLRG